MLDSMTGSTSINEVAMTGPIAGSVVDNSCATGFFSIIVIALLGTDSFANE